MGQGLRCAQHALLELISIVALAIIVTLLVKLVTGQGLLSALPAHLENTLKMALATHAILLV